MGKKGRRDKAAKAKSAAGAKVPQAPQALTPDPEPNAEPPASNAEPETPSSPPTSVPPPPPRPSIGAHVRLGASSASFPPCDPRGAFYDDANDCLLAVDEDADGPLVRCVALPPRGARHCGDSSPTGYPGDNDDAARDI